MEKQEVEKQETPEEIHHGGVQPKNMASVASVAVPFSTRMRSAQKHEQEEIEWEVERNIQKGIEGPPVTGAPVTGLPVTGLPATVHGCCRITSNRNRNACNWTASKAKGCTSNW